METFTGKRQEETRDSGGESHTNSFQLGGLMFNYPQGGHDSNSVQRLPKLDFPRFDGENPKRWIQKCDRYFLLNNIRDEHHKVTMAAMHMEGKADKWLTNLQSTRSITSWFELAEHACIRFENPANDNILGVFSKISQTTTVDDYFEQFENLKGLLFRYYPMLNEHYFVMSFIGGLKDDIKHSKRRTLGICFNCDEVYRPVHFCKKQHLFQTVATEEEVESNEQEEAVTDCEYPPTVESDMEISLHALTGHAIGDTIRIPGILHNCKISVLIDTGSTHSFIDCDLATSLGCDITPTANISVTVANGDKTVSNGICTSLQWKMQNHSFAGNPRLLALGGCDIVLGADWLKKLGDITFNLSNLSITFSYKGTYITLVGDTSPPTLKQIGPKGVKQFFKNNSHGIFAQLTSITITPPPHPTPPIISEVLQDFQNVFANPTQLPPHRSLDHFIPLIPNSSPVNQRPYKCPFFKKYVVEQLVQEMLHSGIKQPSHSPFASPILLVKKKDNCWRFCVDYLKLNNITIKDKFPIPIIDELLDE
ncbi:uncharacterized protein LOC113341994 [Papaver somniferum]|uniref:uncharacterized protein LOC113338171 n=1 Tax=Papaver somniferum TaxID=3469 RepID=UPI000E703F3D|nr:uncharacterized protein LOC113338171 [Papaver somniferum]XP_026442452.1 uncharacterized protein LOC113341994 [Papaver somniferum]